MVMLTDEGELAAATVMTKGQRGFNTVKRYHRRKDGDASNCFDIYARHALMKGKWRSL
ncbi:hypothetical protein PVAG01_08879 [Phlyctema vagabunda]|uniref:Uncharacterized protein n=1 Tax=Phlyctema vagabunda TaxID=108571 RepID=A0ABR4PAR7_9HELO